MAIVRDELGPTLPEILAPRLGVRARTVWLAVAAVVVLVLAIIAFLGLRPDPSYPKVVVDRDELTFNVIYAKSLVRRKPAKGDEILRLQTKPGLLPQSMAVRVRPLPAFKGDATALFAVMASRLTDEMAATYPQFSARQEGRVSVNKQPGYQVEFQTQLDGRTVYGKRVLLVAKSFPSPREALDITLLAARSPSIFNVDAVGTNGAMSTPYRSLRFGTERP